MNTQPVNLEQVNGTDRSTGQVPVKAILPSAWPPLPSAWLPNAKPETK